MDVQVFGNTRAGDLSKVDTVIETVRFHHFSERVRAAARELQQIKKLIIHQTFQVLDLFIGNDHQMPASVGKRIQQCETGFIAYEHKIFLIIRRLGNGGEDRVFRRRRLWRKDVFHPPRRVERFHARRVALRLANVKRRWVERQTPKVVKSFAEKAETRQTLLSKSRQQQERFLPPQAGCAKRRPTT